jgi:hypothetical protein
MVKKQGNEGGAGDGVLPDKLEWERYKDLVLAYPELTRVRNLVESVRQGFVLVTGNRSVEAAVAWFTSILKLNVVIDWRNAYEEVELSELLDDAKLISLPLMWEVPEGVVVANRKATPVRFRRIYVVLSSEEARGLVVFSQPSTGLLVRDTEYIYFGFHGIDEEGNKQVIMEKARHNDKDLTIDFWSVRPRWTSMIMPLTQ